MRKESPIECALVVQAVASQSVFQKAGDIASPGVQTHALNVAQAEAAADIKVAYGDRFSLAPVVIEATRSLDPPLPSESRRSFRDLAPQED